jgi:uncharacterized SAM-binding protein YcdF (DUF218 family)
MLPSLNMLVGTLTAPSTILCLMFVTGCVWLVVSRRRHGLSLIVAASVALIAIIVLPISSLMVIPLEDRFPTPTLPVRVDGIVVLGGSISPKLSLARGRPAVRDASERLFAAAALARLYPGARVILCGGIVSPYPNAVPESTVMRDLLTSIGVPAERLEIETKSRNTYENAIYAMEVAGPKPGEIWLLVTSGTHMPRAVGSFRKAGWTIVPYPVDYLTDGTPSLGFEFELSKELRRMDIAAHEWIGLLGYSLLGWTDEIYPRP